MHLDYSRVEVAVDARRRAMKLWFTTAIGPQHSRLCKIGSPEGEKMPILRKWGLPLSVLVLRREGLSPFKKNKWGVGRFYE